jgi:hypothetical protein
VETDVSPYLGLLEEINKSQLPTASTESLKELAYFLKQQSLSDIHLKSFFML